ncbi:MAG: hypothetical protein ABI440_12475 [Casimicrobiaceae bacterium]
MPSARELLEQADALMRRNRGRETISPAMGPRTLAPATIARGPPPDPGDFPLLTEAMTDAATPVRPAPVERAALPPAAGSRAEPTLGPAPVRDMRLGPERAAPPVAASGSAMRSAPNVAQPAASADVRQRDDAHSVARVSTPALPTSAAQLRERPLATQGVAEIASAIETPNAVPAAEPRQPAPPADAVTPRAAFFHYGDVPVLTDAIEDIDAALLAVASEGEPSIWNDEALRGDDSVLGPSPKSIAVIPEAREIDASRQRNAAAAAAEAATASAVAASTAELIDEVRMQVLQRIDMFTDTGLRDQLGERLKPIVDRASAELVATINQHVGELLRTYVADAIERELDRLRNELR